MSLATLFNIPNFNEPETFQEFSFSNLDQHRIISSALFSQKSIQIPYYLIDPVSLENISFFLYQHQQWHNYINGILGTQGVDLTNVDFSDAGQAASWTRLHGQEHLSWQDKLGTPS